MVIGGRFDRKEPGQSVDRRPAEKGLTKVKFGHSLEKSKPKKRGGEVGV